jgi:hypothetical protein
MHLKHHLNIHFTLPGTYGLLCAWSPPTLRVDVSVLLDLEKDLWVELQKALSEKVVPIISCQSSEFGSSQFYARSPTPPLQLGYILPKDIMEEMRNIG